MISNYIDETPGGLKQKNAALKTYTIVWRQLISLFIEYKKEENGFI